MGAALANCCSGRGEEKKAAARAKDAQAWSFLQGNGGRGGGGTSDIDKFDAAYASGDVKLFVQLLSSKEPIGALPDRLHPWAADPKSIGALAASQLAILAAAGTDNTVKTAIREAGGIRALVSDLSSKEPDRLHAAAVALSFLSVDNAENCGEMFAAGASAKLVPLVADSDIPGLRGSAAQICRNIYVLSDANRAEFARLGGVPALVKLLQLPPEGFDPENLSLQLEAVYHLQDLILGDGEELPKFVEAVKNAGAAKLLEQLKKVDNAELRQEADFLYLRVAD